MKTNKKHLLIVFFLLFSLVLVACGSSDEPEEAVEEEAPAEEAAAPAEEEDAEPAEEAEPSGEKVKVRVFVGLGTGTDPDQIAAQEALAEEFNSTHDDIEMEFLIVPNEESNERLVTMMSGGDPPELVGPGGVDVAARYFDEWVDVSEFIEAEGFDTSDFYGAAVDLYNYPDKTVGLPLGVFPSFLFYNKDLLDAAGVDYPTTDYGDTSWTIDALRELALELTLDANGNNALSPDFDPNNIVQYGFDDSWIDLRGFMAFWDPPGVGRPISDDFKTALINSDEYKQGLAWLNQAIWEDHFITDLAGQDAFYETAGDPLGSEITPMFYSHTWFMPEGLVDLPFEVGFAPAPFNDKGTRVARVHADTFYIPDSTEHKEEAWEVLKWLTSEEHIMDVCLVYGCLPARRSVQEAYLSLLIDRYGENDYDVVFESIDYLDNPQHESIMPEYGRITDLLEAEVYQRVYSEHIEDTDALLEDINAQVQAILDDYWANQ